MTPAELDEIEARAAAATPGPWRPGTSEKGSVFSPFALALEGPNGERNLLRLNPNFRVVEDAVFIAAARADVPALVAEVRRLLALPIAQEELRAASAWYHVVHGEPYLDRAAYAEASARLDAARYALAALEGDT